MKAVSAALKAHLALSGSGSQTMRTCWLAVLRGYTDDSPPVHVTYGFTDHDADLVISGWTAPNNIFNGTYAAATGFTSHAIATSDALNVDNTDAAGILVSPAITDDDLLAGLWDNARIYIFQVNWADLSNTMGPLIQRVGWIGEVSTGRTTFKAEIRGLMQRYTGSLCELTSAACRANLGDARCKVALDDSPSFTVTASVDSVNADNTTFYSAALTQPGPSGGVAITGVTNANPGVVTLADDSLGLVDGQVVTISGVGGMLPINVLTVVHNPSGSTFELGVDTTNTTDYPAYTSGGTVTPSGAESGYFDLGLVTWLTGANAGLVMEVKSYVPGQVTLFLPAPHLISDGSPADTFTISAGCDKTLATCRDKFNNVPNRRAEDWIPGFDRMVQIGRSAAA